MPPASTVTASHCNRTRGWLWPASQDLHGSGGVAVAERGQLDLDAPASTYVDQPVLANGTTIRQLLAHRSSIAEGEEAAYATMMSELDTRWSQRQALAPVPTPTAAPGRKFSYVNANYILLGLVIEKVTGLDAATAFSRDLGSRRD